MKKVPCRLPDSELDIMLVLWHNKPPMSLIKGIDKALQRITIKSFEHAVAFFLLVVLF